MKMKIKTKCLPGGAWRARVPGVELTDPARAFVLHDDDPVLAAAVAVERKGGITCCTALGRTKERAVALAAAYVLGELAFRIRSNQRTLRGGTRSLEEWPVESLFVEYEDEQQR